MFDFEDVYDEIKYDEQKAYTEDECPIDIGMWVSYMPYNDMLNYNYKEKTYYSFLLGLYTIFRVYAANHV